MLNVQEKQVHVAICDSMTVDEIHTTIDRVKAQYQACGQRLCYIALVPEAAPIPAQPVRNAMAAALREIQEHCDFTAVIFMGEGFKAGMKRTVFAGVLMLMMKGKWHLAKSARDLMAKAEGNARRLAQLQVVAKLCAEHGYQV